MENVQVCNKVVTWQTWIANEWLDLFCQNSETLISKSARSVILTADSSKLDHSINNLIKISSLICSNKSDVATQTSDFSERINDLILIRLLHEVKKKVWFISTKCAKSLGIANFLKLCSFKEILFNFAGVSYFVLSEFWIFSFICSALATATSLKPLNRIL